jgi:hypothetical protein
MPVLNIGREGGVLHALSRHNFYLQASCRRGQGVLGPSSSSTRLVSASAGCCLGERAHCRNWICTHGNACMHAMCSQASCFTVPRSARQSSSKRHAVSDALRECSVPMDKPHSWCLTCGQQELAAEYLALFALTGVLRCDCINNGHSPSFVTTSRHQVEEYRTVAMCGRFDGPKGVPN